jgi:hypothetical protein
MRRFARFVSAVALAGTIVPSILLLAGAVSPDRMQWWMLIATIAWFTATPVWMDRADGRRGGAK